MSPLPATIGLTTRPDFLAKASVMTRRIPLSCVVVVVKTTSSLGLTGCAVTAPANPARMTQTAIRTDIARLSIGPPPLDLGIAGRLVARGKLARHVSISSCNYIGGPMGKQPRSGGIGHLTSARPAASCQP